MKKYSKQREAIMQALCATDMHPTAADVYRMVKESIPNISLGTVYRNLTDLKQSGKIAGIMCDGVERFDGKTFAHLHLHCDKCQKIYDLMLKEPDFSDIAKENGFSVSNTVLLLNGVCKNCKNNNG